MAAGGAGADSDGRRFDDTTLQAIREAETDEDASGIGRQLNAGAGLLQPFHLVEQLDAKTVAGQRQRGRQPADACTCDQYAARSHDAF